MAELDRPGIHFRQPRLGWKSALGPIFVLALAAFLLIASIYKMYHFGNAQIDEVVFYLNNDLAGAQVESFSEAAWASALPIILVTLVLAVPLYYRVRMPLFSWIRAQLAETKVGAWLKARSSARSSSPTKRAWRYVIIVLVLSLTLLLNSFYVGQFLKSIIFPGQLFEKYYVNPATVSLEFPSQKRNLVYLYLESMENSLTSKANGGALDFSLIPELDELALDPNNVHFSNRWPKMGGAQEVRGLGWSLAGVTAQTGGIPIINQGLQAATSYNAKENKRFVPGAFMLGDVLRANGYQQTFVLGASARFGGMNHLLKQHGNQKIVDLDSAREDGRIPKDYWVFWGYEDQKLFKFAKEELAELSAKPEPFAISIFTADTHFPNGWLDPSCDRPFYDYYESAHACSSKMVSEFLSWLAQQPYAENTTVIVTGDHLGMQTSFYNAIGIPHNYTRTVYNAFINPAVKPTVEKSRVFTTMDMYPTTLAAMGVKIPGERLGLGTNLFSDKPTLPEELGGIHTLNDELEKRSAYFENQIMVAPKE